MTAASLGLIIVYLAVALLCVKPLGLYITRVVEGRSIWPLRVGAPAEALIYRLCGIDPAAEMGWKKYAVALVLFNGWARLRCTCCSACSCGCRSIRRRSPTFHPTPRSIRP